MNSCQLGDVSNNIFILSKVFLCTYFSNQYLSFFLNLKAYPQYLTHAEFLCLLVPYTSKKSGRLSYSPQWPRCMASCAWHGSSASHGIAKRDPCHAEKRAPKHDPKIPAPGRASFFQLLQSEPWDLGAPTGIGNIPEEIQSLPIL